MNFVSFFPVSYTHLDVYKRQGPVWWLPQGIMWNKDNIPNEIELKKMKAKLLKELEKHV